MSYERIVDENDFALLKTYKDRLKVARAIDEKTRQLEIIRKAKTLDEFIELINYDEDVMPQSVKDAALNFKKSIDQLKSDLTTLEGRLVLLDEDIEIYDEGKNITMHRLTRENK